MREAEKNKIKKFYKEDLMQEQLENEEEISLADIFHALWEKLWIILISLLVGAIAGASFGFVKYHNVHYYGAEVRYYISSSTNNDNTSATTGTQTANANAYKESVFRCIVALLDGTEQFFKSELFPILPEAEGVEIYSEEYYRLLKIYKKDVTYTYNVTNSTIDNVLIVSVSILNEEELAQNMLVAITEVMPSYLVEFMSNDIFGTTQCQQLDNLQCKTGLLNAGETTKQTLKFGVIVGLVAALIACLIVVLVDRMDTRLRDYDDITRKFDIPVLGVIPRIEEITEEQNHSKKSKKTEATK